MAIKHRQLDVEHQNDIVCAHLRKRKFEETEVQELSDELLSLILDDGCRKLVLSLGPGSPECLYSIFLAKLFTVRRRIGELGGTMKLCDVSDDVIGVFEACHLKEFFEFYPDQASAMASFSS